MRRVACFAATSVLEGASRDAELDRLLAVLENWLKQKGLTDFGSEQKFRIRKTNDEAEYSRRTFEVSSGRAVEITLEQRAKNNRFLTRFCLGGLDGSLHLFAELRAGSSDFTVAPLPIQVRAPKVLRALFAARAWTAGRTPIATKTLRFEGTTAAKELVKVIRHPDRNLPIVVVSRYQGQALTPEFVDEVAADLCGLALVVDLDDAASMGLTRLLGKEWSCYLGAIRIYWPFRNASASPYSHPLWTRERLIANATNAQQAAWRIRGELTRRLFALSTFAADEPLEISRLKEESARIRFEEMRKRAEGTGNQSQLAEEYFNECVRLTTRVQQLEEESRSLTDKVRNYEEAYRYTEVDAADDISPEPRTTITTVEHAVSQAGQHFSDELIFGEDVAQSVKTLVEDAGPPEKVYDYLKTLAELTRTRRTGSLGKDMVIWLKNQGVRASSESETIRKSAVEMRKRTWGDGGGTRPFNMHLKPNDHTSPDRCARIYFDYDENRERTIIGYVGRHL